MGFSGKRSLTMHIPDGFVSGPINGATAVVSAAAVGFGLWRLKKEVKEREFTVPLLAMTAAFVFAAQMLNFPIGGGTSGHFLGAVTAAALLGPWSSCLVLALVITIQGVFFGDGGISALGSNILNMGIIGATVGYFVMRLIRAFLPSGRGGYLASAAIASWSCVVLASAVCALELALSGTSPARIAFPAMVGTHALIGIGEAFIAVAVLSAVATARPDVIPDWARLEKTGHSPTGVRKSVWVLAGAGLAIALALALFGSPFASKSPDGLDKFAEERGFAEGKPVWAHAPMADYKVPGVESEGASTGIAGLIGTLLVFGLGYMAIKLVLRPKTESGRDAVK
jgi:cobalt/nickel transport system permease protein